jgi:hypothetical protein
VLRQRDINLDEGFDWSLYTCRSRSRIFGLEAGSGLKTLELLRRGAEVGTEGGAMGG